MHYARLKDHDYHYGYYFVTINTSPRRNVLSQIVGGRVVLSEIGKYVGRTALTSSHRAPAHL